MIATRSDQLRNQNRQIVLAAIRQHGCTSRTDIAKTTKLSAATVSAITADFLDEDVLLESQSSVGPIAGRGRPQVALRINPQKDYVCTVYFQWNCVTVDVLNYAGQSLGQTLSEIATSELSSADVRKVLCDCIDSAMDCCTPAVADLSCIVIGFQGVVDRSGSSILWSPIFNHNDLPIREWLERHYSAAVQTANECDLIAHALHLRKPEKYAKHFGVVLLDHGVGMGLYLRGGIINGTHSSGIEFGHMTYTPDGALCRCGNSGCIEAYAGDYAIARNARGEHEQMPPSTLLEAPDLDSIKAAAAAGDTKAINAIELAGAAIGTGIASLYALTDHFPIVLVGRGTMLFEYMEESITAALKTAPGHNSQPADNIDCYLEAVPLVQEGGAISALQMLDLLFADKRQELDLVE